MQERFPMLQHEVVLMKQRKQKCGPSVEMGEFWVGAGRIERGARHANRN